MVERWLQVVALSGDNDTVDDGWKTVVVLV